tara:strand:+ start:197 stop:727 length:531 start_codon:yes stop_codon:yes gene_type:complete
MDIEVNKGQITGVKRLAVHNEYAIIYTEKEDVKALQQAWEWYEILMMTCRNFKDQGVYFDVRSVQQAKNWLNRVAVNNIPSSINNPVVLVGEQIIKSIETIIGDLIGEQYIACMFDFEVDHSGDTWGLFLKLHRAKIPVGFTEQELNDIAQDIKENPSVKAHFESAKTLSLEKESR